jgi:uncharacterized phiE125 gp8 family phage protein
MDEVRAHLSLVDDNHDTHLRRLLAAAVEVAERWTGRALLQQTWRLAIDAFPSCGRQEIVLPRPPLISITSVEYVDENGTLQTLSSSGYNATADREPARIEPAYNETWPATRYEREAVRVTYVAGYGTTAADVPEAIRHAILLMAAHWFVQREPVVTGAIATEIPMSAAFLLDGFRTGANAEWFHLAE